MKNQTLQTKQDLKATQAISTARIHLKSNLNNTLLFILVFGTFLMLTSCQDKNRIAILSVTDLHFNPYHDSVIVKQLIQTSYSHWDTIFSQIKDSAVATYNHETTPALFQLLLKSMGKHYGEISTVFFTGDILCHSFNELFYEYSGDTNNKNDFIDKTMGYVSMKFRQTFPNTPIYFSLGNNDSYMGDYAIVDEGNFLKNTSELFCTNFINPQNTKERNEFLESYSAHGYYNLEFPAIDNSRIIGVNTIFFSTNYTDTSSTPTPGEAELDWLEEQLFAAEKSGEKVWLLLHIPPGINVYNSQHNSTQQDIKAPLFWQQEYNEQYLQLQQQFYKTIAASFAGHTHMDDFRLIYNQDTINRTPLDFIHITPSVSPIFGNNPSYQVFLLDKVNGNIEETTSYYVDLTKVQTDFNKEYDYTITYNFPPDLTGLDSLYQTMPYKQKMLDNYTTFYPSSSTATGITDSWRWYWSGIGNLTSDEFIEAYSQLGK